MSEYRAPSNRNAWAASSESAPEDHSARQRPRVHQQGARSVGLRARRDARLQPARQTDGQRFHREPERQVPCRVPQCQLVPRPRRDHHLSSPQRRRFGPGAYAARLGHDAAQPRKLRSGGSGNGKAGRRSWRRRSPPTARRSGNGPANACRSTGRRPTTTKARRPTLGEREGGTARLEQAIAAYRAAQEEAEKEGHRRLFPAVQQRVARVERLLRERNSSKGPSY
jgi:hypothetical protein